MLVQISDHLAVFRGAINVGIIREQRKAMLIDFGTGNVLKVLDGLGLDIDRVVFTHHHRDQACGAWELSDTGTKLGVPEEERWLFDDVARYWGDPGHRWHLYNFHPHHLTLTESIRVDFTVAGGGGLEWDPAHVEVLSTPGHTDGSLSFIVEIDGIRAAFVGDLIYDAGKVWEVYSMQKGTETTDYHGFLGSRDEVMGSLQAVLGRNPTHLIPSHGEVMEEPEEAVASLERNLRACHESYASISSLRHYFPHLFGEYLSGPRVMPMGRELEVPDCLHHIGTTWLLVSKDGHGFAMDCGSEKVIDDLRRMVGDGRLKGIDGLWITHYHDDHVDFVNEFAREFGCPIVAEEHVAEIVEKPLAWRLPCISPERVEVDRRTRDGESWRWREYTLTSYHLPGQTLYSGGLFVEGGGIRILFSGDSFTPGGIDDHCCSNRNFLGRGVGYDKCIRLVKEIQPDLIFNAHVDPGFSFSAAQLEFMEREIRRRWGLFAALLPWENPNLGMDEHWVRCEPYEQSPAPGTEVVLEVVITNHGTKRMEVAARIVPPDSWRQSPHFNSATVPPGTECRLPQRVAVPEGFQPRRWVIPVDVRVGRTYMPGFTEVILDVGSAGPSEGR